MQRYFATEMKNNKLILSDDDHHHIKKVMRMNNHDLIEVVYDNKLYLCEIDNINNVDINVIEERTEKHDKYPFISLIIPTLKEQKLDLIFQKGTEIGVNEFIIVPYERSMVKYDSKKESNKLERWKKILKEASEQSHRLNIPNIKLCNNFNFIDELDGLKLICSTNEKDKYIKDVLKNNSSCDKIFLAIGPEGGISPKEEELLEKKGFLKITLGSQIMRVETVPIFLASIIKYEFTE